MTDPDHRQRLGAQTVTPPPDQDHHTPLAATTAVRRMLQQDPGLHSLLANLARQPREPPDPTLAIHRQLEETPDQNVVVRWFPGDTLPLAMTEAESLRHYGPHQPQGTQTPNKRQASLGWGLAKAVDSLALALVLVALIAALTIDCNPDLYRAAQQAP